MPVRDRWMDDWMNYLQRGVEANQYSSTAPLPPETRFTTFWLREMRRKYLSVEVWRSKSFRPRLSPHLSACVRGRICGIPRLLPSRVFVGKLLAAVTTTDKARERARWTCLLVNSIFRRQSFPWNANMPLWYELSTPERWCGAASRCGAILIALKKFSTEMGVWATRCWYVQFLSELCVRDSAEICTWKELNKSPVNW